jgi:hypothetical protein
VAVCRINYATTPYKKRITPSVTLSFSRFPTIPATSTPLEIESKGFSETENVGRTNQKTPLGTLLVAKRCPNRRIFGL